MSITLRPPRLSELPELSALCLRSKAHWGYDATFLEACRAELTLTEAHLDNPMIVAVLGEARAGVAAIALQKDEAEIDLLFIEPALMGRGLGRRLMLWCRDAARHAGARRLLIQSDPQAEGFYRRMGARRIGVRPSASVPGRDLPLLACALR
ncbi:MAG: GNAT family N-acetyltransferase [Rhodobacteraceae bacterium]|nr:GNAT family N-acetyltransferase [Paracoccaceae bacterium]